MNEEKKEPEKTPESKPEPKEKEDRELDKINEQRWEYDLPPITRRDIREYHRRYMEEKYGYDIDK